uniref:Homeodomain n=1 Tax=Auricularia cornea TaxID=1238391 RepID=A0A7S9NWR0_9AGAM|nr:homeodomain [Auricularia cornea]
MPGESRNDCYGGLIQTSERMSAMLDAWMRQHNLQPSPPALSCPVPELVLASPSPLAGTSHSTTTFALSMLLSEEVTRLRNIVEQQYQQLADELAKGDAHSDCAIGRQCPLLRQIGSALQAVYNQKVSAMTNDLNRLCSRTDLSVDDARRMSDKEYLCVLEFAYGQSPRLNKQDLLSLARATGRSEKQISIWFQNRRARDKTRSVARREPPRTIEELETRLRTERSFVAASTKHQHLPDGTGDGSSDSGSVSSRSPSSSEFNVDDLAKLLEDFHIDDDAQTGARTAPRRALPVQTGSRRLSTSSEDSPIELVTKRPRPSKPRCNPSKAATATVIPEHPYARRPISRIPQRRAAARVVASGQGRAAPSACASTSAGSADGLSLSPGSSSPAEAVSCNRTRRIRKPAPLPIRRPSEIRSRDTSPSSCPSLSSPSTSSSRASSQSSQSYLVLGDMPQTPSADQLYYKDTETGEFVAIAGSRMLNLHDGGASVRTGRLTLAEHGPVVLGSPGQPQFAPDHDPRALSLNLLQHPLHLNPEPAVQATPLLDLPSVPPDFAKKISECAVTSVVSTVLPSLDSLDILAEYGPADAWAPNPAPLDIVNHTYDQSWSTNPAHANDWAHILGVEP